MDARARTDPTLDDLVRHASTGIGSVDLDGRWRSGNRALGELLARDSWPLPDLPALFEGRDRVKVERGLKRFARGDRDSDVHDLTLKRPDGRTLKVRLDLCRIGDDSPPSALLVLLADITAARQIRRQLKASEARMQSVIRAMAEGVVVVDRSGGIRIANTRAAELLGIGQERLLTGQLGELGLVFHDVNGDPLAPGQVPVARTLATGAPQRDVTLGLYDADGGMRWLEMSTEPVQTDSEGRIEAVVATFSDITRRHMAELKLRDSEERLSLAMSGAKLGFWHWELERKVLSFSESAANLLGYADDEVVESRSAIMELVHADDREALIQRMQAHLDAFQRDFDMDVRMCRKSGDFAWMNIRGRVVTRGKDDAPRRVAGTIMDIGERKQLEARLHELATTDGLTGVFNRRHGQEWMEAALDAAERLNHPLGFVLLDIDHFKQVNDRFGHDAGDEVLRQIAALLRDRIRGTDAVARWGGEEFAVMLPGTDGAGTVQFAQQLLEAIRKLSTPDGRPITSSLGAVARRAGEGSGELVKRADRLMYRAKQAGRDRVEAEAD
ncbi:diguanylate cyclase [Wenzhouxiangella sp. XN79A]|uniref:sensor domain-containing diguanylate cyclase n=1 Tax=Wenzhouxiangella sp. XN79A TaxID=2724193 RepID=UPI00144A5386|nr:diguanylate cyclase [Wenzhouxiangella sp. XN79A]NKI36304.1 diguanylate cyclase [Wenzhouxiangella sp. XN79A]